MSRREKFFGNKYLMTVFGIFLFAFYCNATYAFYWEYLRWNNLLFVTLNAIMAVAGVALLSWFVLETGDKSYSTGGKLGRVAAAVVAFEATQWLLLTGINIWYGKELEAKLAISVTTPVLLVLYGIINILFFRNIAKKGCKVVNIALSVVISVGFFATGLSLLREYIPTQWTYPIYRSFNSQGGTATLDADLVYDFAYSTEKPLQTDKLGDDTSFGIRLAKNEREGFQLLLCAGKREKSVRVEMSDFTDAAGNVLPVRVFRAVYTAVPGFGDFFSDKYADALLPLSADELTALEKDYSQAFYFETLSTAQTPAGDYTAALHVYNEKDERVLESTVTAAVWNFTLPETPASETAMGLASSNFWTLNGFEDSGYGWNGVGGATLTDEQRAMYLQYYNFLLEHRISPYVLPYDILDERADAYMSDPRVTSFCIPYPAEDEKLLEYYEKVSSNPEWAAKGYFYPIDEPHSVENVEQYIAITDRLARLCPGYNMVTPFYSLEIQDEETGELIKNFEMQCGRSNILCPETICFDENEQLYDLMRARVAEGDRVWWYVCCGPLGDYNNFFIRQEAIQHRLLMWQEKMLDVTGLLYWDTVCWDKANPWESSKTWDSYDAAGDGCLLYPGAYVGLSEPIGTLRLANITDGLEDYDYLTLADETFGRDWIDERIARVTSSLTAYTDDDALLEAVRCEIGDALSR